MCFRACFASLCVPSVLCRLGPGLEVAGALLRISLSAASRRASLGPSMIRIRPTYIGTWRIYALCHSQALATLSSESGTAGLLSTFLALLARMLAKLHSEGAISNRDSQQAISTACHLWRPRCSSPVQSKGMDYQAEQHSYGDSEEERTDIPGPQSAAHAETADDTTISSSVMDARPASAHPEVDESDELSSSSRREGLVDGLEAEQAGPSRLSDEQLGQDSVQERTDTPEHRVSTQGIDSEADQDAGRREPSSLQEEASQPSTSEQPLADLQAKAAADSAQQQSEQDLGQQPQRPARNLSTRRSSTAYRSAGMGTDDAPIGPVASQVLLAKQEPSAAELQQQQPQEFASAGTQAEHTGLGEEQSALSTEHLDLPQSEASSGAAGATRRPRKAAQLVDKRVGAHWPGLLLRLGACLPQQLASTCFPCQEWVQNLATLLRLAGCKTQIATLQPDWGVSRIPTLSSFCLLSSSTPEVP